ncbi:MAG: T9SS type A sorting domain-containing protein [Ignavibacteriales bacterium]|nr:T9SS type A sorting domain-containing protein [Ignavibacteriales bacterium]
MKWHNCLCALAALFSSLAPAQAHLNLKYTDGSDGSSQIVSLSKITFSPDGEQIYFHHHELGLVAKNTNAVQNITFGDIPSGSALPVELSSFSAAAKENAIVLNWVTATEVNSAMFVLERNSGLSWQVIANIKASGNSNAAKNYSFTDKNLKIASYQYRLKMIDVDGSFSVSTMVAVELAAPKMFSVKQNYPNPFNPSTIIRYTIPKTGSVEVLIYNILGAAIKCLYAGIQDPGLYSIEWDGKSSSGNTVASGIYLYRIAYNANIITKKMLFVK